MSVTRTYSIALQYPVYCLESLSKGLWNVRVLDSLGYFHPRPIVSISSKCLVVVIGWPVHISCVVWLRIVNKIFVASIRDYMITYRSDFLIFSSFLSDSFILFSSFPSPLLCRLEFISNQRASRELQLLITHSFAFLHINDCRVLMGIFAAVV